MVSPVKLCPFLPSALFSRLSAATGQISVLAFVLTSICPVFSVPWLFSLPQNYLVGDWRKLTSMMAKFGLDWVESSVRTKPAVLFKTEVSINPALQAGYEVFYFCYYLCRCDIKAELPVKKLQQLNVVCHNMLCTLCDAHLYLVIRTNLEKCSFTVKPFLRLIQEEKIDVIK